MKVEKFIEIIGADFFTGVPDSQLKSLSNYLMNRYGINPNHHIIAANEGNCTALAAGYHLATGKVPVIYMQNSGEGNIVNPVVSLMNNKVYKIPAIFIIGWRGEPGIHDEPQHIYQGEITRKILDDIGIENFVIGSETTVEEVQEIMNDFKMKLEKGFCVAFVIRKNAFSFDVDIEYYNNNLLRREEVIQHIISVSKTDPIISTTGKISRELFEIRDRNRDKHIYDFLTVGSMGHCSSIALGIAIMKSENTIWCIDGDGSILMHLGAIPVIASCNPDNLIHIVINNGAHESVGGQPTVMENLEIADIAKACGYPYTVTVRSAKELDFELQAAKERKKLSLIEVKCAVGSRHNLGRPTISSLQNKEGFMSYLKSV